ncbi:MAG: hypothetical protein WDN24_09825 [Sphingomonas sp.]
MTLLALLLIPGVSEAGFFYNHDVPAAALGASALALLYLRDGWRVGLASGLLLGLGILTRADVALLAPAVPAVLVHRFGATPGRAADARRRRPRRLRRAGAAACRVRQPALGSAACRRAQPPRSGSGR